MITGFVIGYDPGGAGAHGVAVLEVAQEGVRWNPGTLWVDTTRTLRDAVGWLNDTCRDGRIVAVGVDTLTEWNSGVGGWRPADQWLRTTYPAVAKSVVSPNYINGSMAVNGAAFLTQLTPRFRRDDTMITEAHPKVCFFAMTGRKHTWNTARLEMAAWLLKELEIDSSADLFGGKDHCFDAGIAALAALRGINRDWELDLHAAGDNEEDNRVMFCGKTHYRWPRMATAAQRTP